MWGFFNLSFSVAIITDHTRVIGGGAGEMNVYSLVLSRLLFLVDDADTPPSDNANKISLITYEVMLWLNQCFRLDAALVGNEENYTEVQLSLIADVVAYYILLYRAIALGANVQGYATLGTTTVSGNGLYIKKADSDDTSVEWAVLDSAKSSAHNGITIGALMDGLYKAMCDKMNIYDCIICRCANCSLSLETKDNGVVQPFIILGLC